MRCILQRARVSVLTMAVVLFAPVARAGCWVIEEVPTEPSLCACTLSLDDGYCPDVSRGVFYNDVPVPAGPGEVGFVNYVIRLETVGAEYPCVSEVDGLGLFLCASSIGLCTISCASIPTGVGIALCLACLATASAGCAWCTVVTCAVDYTQPTDVDVWILTDQSGTCVGDGG